MTRLIGVHGESVFNTNQLHTTALYDISVVICCLLIYYSISREIYRLSVSSTRTDPCHRLKGTREVWIMDTLMLMGHYCSWIEWVWKIDMNLIMIVHIKVNWQLEAVVVAVVIVVATSYTFDASWDFTKSCRPFWTNVWSMKATQNHFQSQNKYSELVISAAPADGLTL